LGRHLPPPPDDRKEKRDDRAGKPLTGQALPHDRLAFQRREKRGVPPMPLGQKRKGKVGDRRKRGSCPTACCRKKGQRGSLVPYSDQLGRGGRKERGEGGWSQGMKMLPCSKGSRMSSPRGGLIWSEAASKKRGGSERKGKTAISPSPLGRNPPLPGRGGAPCVRARGKVWAKNASFFGGERDASHLQGGRSLHSRIKKSVEKKKRRQRSSVRGCNLAVSLLRNRALRGERGKSKKPIRPCPRGRRPT